MHFLELYNKEKNNFEIIANFKEHFRQALYWFARTMWVIKSENLHIFISVVKPVKKNLY
jgi:hypothetical protein